MSASLNISARNISGAFAVLSLLWAAVMLGSVVYATLDIFAPSGGFLTLDLRSLNVLGYSVIMAVISTLGLLSTALGVLVTRDRNTSGWWSRLGVLYGLELLTAGLLIAVM